MWVTWTNSAAWANSAVIYPNDKLVLSITDAETEPVVDLPKHGQPWGHLKQPSDLLQVWELQWEQSGLQEDPCAHRLWIMPLKRLFNTETWDPVALIFSFQQVTLTANWVQRLNLISKLRIAAQGVEWFNPNAFSRIWPHCSTTQLLAQRCPP